MQSQDIMYIYIYVYIHMCIYLYIYNMYIYKYIHCIDKLTIKHGIEKPQKRGIQHQTYLNMGIQPLFVWGLEDPNGGANYQNG